MPTEFHMDRLLQTALKKGADEVFLTPGSPPHLFSQGRFLAQLPRQFTPEDARHCVDSLMPYALRDKFDDRGVTFDFELGTVCTIRMTVSKDGDSYRFRLNLARRDKMEPAE